jgi:hypothetical protein
VKGGDESYKILRYTTKPRDKYTMVLTLVQTESPVEQNRELRNRCNDHGKTTYSRSGTRSQWRRHRVRKLVH